MQTKIIEASNIGVNGLNWGKFMVGRFTEEQWQYRSPISESGLLNAVGWSKKHIVVFDLQTGEGAIFLPGGLASADLAKHKIWVCPLYESFLTWLYQQDLTDLETLPPVVDILDATSALYGYRRKGPKITNE